VVGPDDVLLVNVKAQPADGNRSRSWRLAGRRLTTRAVEIKQNLQDRGMATAAILLPLSRAARSLKFSTIRLRYPVGSCGGERSIEDLSAEGLRHSALVRPAAQPVK
jgi:hypothetical protein